MDVVILAGGRGTRLASAVTDRPKPLALVAGRPFLEHLMDFWIREGAKTFLLSTGYRAEDFSRHFGRMYRGVPVRHAVEHEPLGTGGGLIHAVRELSPRQSFWICNGDTLLEFSTRDMEYSHRAHEADLTLAVLPPPPDNRYGAITLGSDGRIAAFGIGPFGAAVNGGVYLAEPELFGDTPASGERVSLEAELFPKWIREGKRLYGFGATGAFLDIGIPESYSKADDFVRSFQTKR